MLALLVQRPADGVLGLARCSCHVCFAYAAMRSRKERVKRGGVSVSDQGIVKLIRDMQAFDHRPRFRHCPVASWIFVGPVTSRE
jgi:hypothetical protein